MGAKLESQVLRAAGVFFVCTAVAGAALYTAVTEGYDWFSILLRGILAVGLALCTLVCLDIWRLRPADSHTLETLFSQYSTLTYVRLTRPYYKWRVRTLLIDPKKTNEESLMKILRHNASSEYGRKYKFSEIKSREDFIRAHPFTRYEDYKDYIDRIVAGETNVLYPGKTIFCGMTSGTTGSPKLVPYQDIYRKSSTLAYFTLPRVNCVHLMNLKRYKRFYLYSKVKMTEGNIPYGVVGMAMQKQPIHNLTPTECMQLFQEEASYYVQAFFALSERELQYISGFSSDLMYYYMKFINQYEDSLCDDIEKGTISTTIGIPKDIHAALSKKIKADPERAAELRREFQKGKVGLMKRIWPDLEFVIVSSSGSFKMCANHLAQSYLKGVKTMPHGHGSSESICGINLEDQPGTGDCFTFLPYPCFTEFIPLKDVDNENPETLSPEQLAVGHEYEVVSTSENGLCRYRTGDIIKVIGHNYNSPKYEFLYRLGQRLSISYERTPENLIYDAMKQSESALPPGVKLMNFTVTESFVLEQIPEFSVEGDYNGFYVFFIETNTDEHLDVVKFAEKLEDNLTHVYELYGHYRSSGAIAKPRVFQAESGAFSQVKHIVWKDNPNGQFKFPRVLRNVAALKNLYNSRVQNATTDSLNDKQVDI